MRKYLIVVSLGVLIFLIIQKSVFSNDVALQKKSVTEVNDFAIDKLGLSLEEISLLFSFKDQFYIGPEVIEEYKNKDHMSKLLKEKYITLVPAPNLGNDIPSGNEFFYFELTQKSRIIVGY